ncbi:MAG TPA: hypothetical protein VHY79_18290 [Rhizomicrobium sp.]|nr:hypothetical protein [Rhizomicrobium sp.]
MRVGCFIAVFDSTSDNPYLNYAIPEEDAEPGEADIAALIAAFAERGRRPQLEYIPAAAPCVEAAMIGAGFAVEQRLPIMVRSSGGPIAQPAADVVADLASRDEHLVEAGKTQAQAFGDQASNPDRLRRLVAAGGLLAVVRMRGAARIIGVGGARSLLDGVTEIAGIGVLPESAVGEPLPRSRPDSRRNVFCAERTSCGSPRATAMWNASTSAQASGAHRSSFTSRSHPADPPRVNLPSLRRRA